MPGYEILRYGYYTHDKVALGSLRMVYMYADTPSGASGVRCCIHLQLNTAFH